MYPIVYKFNGENLEEAMGKMKNTFSHFSFLFSFVLKVVFLHPNVIVCETPSFPFLPFQPNRLHYSHHHAIHLTSFANYHNLVGVWYSKR